MKDLPTKGFDSFLVKTSLKGIENLGLIPRVKGPLRKAMSLPLLKILGHAVAKTNWEPQSKQVIWSAMCVGFFGSFRMGELLCKSELSFSSSETLVWADVRFLQDGSVQIHNKLSKNRTQGGEVIDLFPFQGSCCPVASLLALKNSLPYEPFKPVFRFRSGKFLTQRSLNQIMRECLVPIIGSEGNNFSGHSFRAGLPSALAACQSLASENAIKKWGRWKSNSFEKYTRLNHKAKKEVFELFKKALER